MDKPNSDNDIIDDLLNLTDSEESSTSSDEPIFDTNQPLILELHELKKDDPTPENVAEAKKKLKRKKKRGQIEPDRSNTSTSSSNLSEDRDLTPSALEVGKEEFYDAHESYHALPENQTSKALTTAAMLQSHSEHGQNPKNTQEQNVTAQHRSSSRMDKPAQHKGKNKKPAGKPKSTKKRKSDGPTCSMFLSEITRRLTLKKRQEEESPKNIVQMIIESITNALPVKFSKRTPPKKDSPMKIETLQTFAPELLPKDTLNIPTPILNEDVPMIEIDEPVLKQQFKMPKMPIVNSEVIKIAIEKQRRASMEDAAVNTGGEHDVASEIAKHVGTLKKISLIAEEFNQKTAKNLKEIVDSVQEDLIKKLEEIKSQQRALTIAEQTLPNTEEKK